MGAFWKGLARLIAAPVILLALSLPALTADHTIKSAYRLTFTSIAVTPAITPPTSSGICPPGIARESGPPCTALLPTSV